MKFYTMDHRGGLHEALKTKKEISQSFFNYLRKFKFNGKFYYTPYGYDECISCYRFILHNHQKHINNPCWLLLEMDKNLFKKFKKCNLLKEVY